ncbi:head GIN domain-containing protein [Robertkochia solimangrovi]|uniref:head GIN domain-containing protein n=1 Tax=Robertkochia solimangrovi TaxID=2213046 RepID=UPI00117FC354|nr:head GIN domain-containing protein [Robertkochia solimangrovi]TRZ41085.1 DUF2807 domain-containing protein [Robertkochia solimangrovi]
MSTLIKVITALVLSAFMASCNLGLNFSGAQGNGNVVTESRSVSGFDKIHASEGLDVVVSQGATTEVKVEADENIMPLILTEVSDNTLRIHCKDPIGKARSKKIFVTVPSLRELSVSSGADLESMGLVESDNISLSASSGADLKVEIKADDVHCNTSSGADIRVVGSANSINADASSGSDINADDLQVKTAIANASSGADISINATEKVTKKTSSGGSIHISGSAEIVKND